MRIWFPIFLSIILMLIMGALVKKSIAKNSIINSLKAKKIKDVSITLFSLAITWTIFEIFFGFFLVHSDGFGFTLASKRWHQKYWRPINSLDYRDFEHEWKDSVLFILGDSFAAGHGINSIENRFSAGISNKLGPNWSTAVVAENGWNTFDELEALKKHPIKPNKILVSYFVNDIEHAVKVNNLTRPILFTPPNKVINFIVGHSFVLNWFFWKSSINNSGEIYWQYLVDSYQNENIWESHKKEIINLLNFANSINSEIYFVIWPHLAKLHESSVITSKVDSLILSLNVKTLNLQPILKSRHTLDIIVSQYDAHPNEAIHKEVSNLIFQKFYLIKANK